MGEFAITDTIKTRTILANLVENEPFTRKVIPYLLSEYFTDAAERVVFDIIQTYMVKYNSLPSKEALQIDLIDKEISEDVREQGDHLIVELKADPKTALKYLVDETEKFCKERAIYIALTQSLDIIQNKEKNKTGGLGEGAIPNIMSAAIGLSFDSHIGHDYFDDADARYEKLHAEENKIPFDVEILNRITRGGLANGTLSIIIAGTNVGKSAIMCHMAASNLKIGKNVLYITLEMAEEKIAERIDANLLDLTLDEVHALDKETFLKRVDTVKSLCSGKVKVKQYPTKQASSANFRFLLNELKLKSNFIPDIIYVDYMNICISTSLKGTKAPLDQHVVAISEELRGLAVEYDLPIVTATQLNREGFKKNDPGMDDTAQAFGVVFVGDFIIALVRTDESDAKGQILCIQLKNRESSASEMKRFFMGVNITKMQFYDVEDGGLMNEATEAKIAQNYYEGIGLGTTDENLDMKGNSFVGLF